MNKLLAASTKMLILPLIALNLVGCGGGSSTPAVTVTYTVGGSVSGLTGTGLVLQDSGGDNLAISASGNFTFATPLAGGAAYAVTVKTQPSSPAQTCVVTNGSGTVGAANVSNVAVACTSNPPNTFSIGGMVSGLTGTGLVLQDSGGDNLAISASGNFTFSTPLAGGAAYAVTVKTQPSSPAQTCVVTNGSGTVGAANVSNVAVACTSNPPNTFSIGGMVSGLTGTGLVLQDNSGDDLPVNASGSFTFATMVATGGAYAVTVKTQPSSPAQTCVVTNGSGTVGAANVTNVAVACSNNAPITFTVGGTVSGLTGTGLVLQDNGGDDLPVNASGSFTFATVVATGGAYAVTVKTQPTSPAQTCVVTNGSGTVGAANVSNVAVACTNNAPITFTVGGAVSGLTGTGLVLQNNGGDNRSISASGNFTFATPLAGGAAYAVTVKTQPTSPAQTCVVTNGSGTVGAANVTNVAVACTNNARYVYVTNRNDNSISTFQADRSTGVLTLLNSSTGTDRTPVYATLDPTGKYLYVVNQDGNAGSGANGTITGYDIDPSTGALTPMAGGPVQTGVTPTNMVFDPTAAYAYVANLGDGTISQFNVSTTDGTLTAASSLLGNPYSAGSSPQYAVIDPTGSYLYAVSNTQGVFQFGINADGSLTSLAGPAAVSGPTSAAITPNGALIYLPRSDGSGNISGLDIGTTGGGSPGQLTANAFSPTFVTAGAVLNSVAIDPTGQYLYTVDSAGPNLYAFALSGANPGKLVPTPTNPSWPTGSAPKYVVVDPTGTFVYVDDATNGIYAYTVDANGGVIGGGSVPGSPFAAGDFPMGIAITP